MGRPKGPPKTTKEVSFEDRQIVMIEALREVARIGKPDFSAVVRAAVDFYLPNEIDALDAEQRARFERLTRAAARGRVTLLKRPTISPPV